MHHHPWLFLKSESEIKSVFPSYIRGSIGFAAFQMNPETRAKTMAWVRAGEEKGVERFRRTPGTNA